MGNGTMTLDSQTLALIRIATATATGDETILRERMIAARAADVPAVWVEELLLQSFLNVGYPLALVAFSVWREVAGPPRETGGGGGGGGGGADRARGMEAVDGARPGGVRRGVRTDLSQAARESAGAAPRDRAARGGGRVRQNPVAAGARYEATRAVHARRHRDAAGGSPIARAPEGRSEYGVYPGRSRCRIGARRTRP